MRYILISECMELLMKNNFEVSKPVNRACFDILAKRDDIRLVLKILKNIDSFSKEQSSELKMLSKAIRAVPLIIGARTRNAPMEDGVVYDRYNIKAVTFETFKDFLEGSPPIVYANRGGFFVKIDGETLKRVREEKKISVGELAEAVGVSRKTIYKYENYSANPSVDIAIKIEEYLDAPLVRGIDLFEPIDEDIEVNKEIDGLKKEIINFLNQLGFKSFPLERAPFDAVADDKKEILLTNIDKEENIEVKKKVYFVREIAKLLEAYTLLVLEKKEREYKNVPVLSKKELEDMNNAMELINYIKSIINH
ncbi:transcriptional regulator, XRE family [Methanocaldococcus infernus ME]|uniref:Putative HTH-type transcriptional regulatory protein Metin_1036 n=1 Tax=Methanocaldococcus infernus (strain DSM 11812 / JCM 15783 / ME) TaxID=573063 RepID=D5VSZ1_METIM|nr:transcriptional regulator [Methanocaldococcus infernus]ADG13694.1 transcriptional regulator, XRE family [Methanocaldococcus infernus ME]